MTDRLGEIRAWEEQNEWLHQKLCALEKQITILFDAATDVMDRSVPPTQRVTGWTLVPDGSLEGLRDALLACMVVP